MADKEDNPRHQEAMASPNAVGFMEAMKLEVRTSDELGVFNTVNRPTHKKALLLKSEHGGLGEQHNVLHNYECWW